MYCEHVTMSLVAMLLAAGSVTATEAINVSVQLSARELVAGEPLAIAATVRNTGQNPARFERPVGDSFGTLALEIRGPSDPSFRRVGGHLSGMKGGEYEPTVLAAGDQVVSFEILFRFRGEPVFAGAGTYEIRVLLSTGTYVSSSDSVVVQVAPVSAAEMELLARNGSLLERIVGTSVSSTAPLSDLQDLQVAFASSSFQQLKPWITLASTLAHRKLSSDVRSAAKVGVDKVTGQIFDAVWADRLVGEGSLDEAGSLVSTLPNGYERTRLQTAIREKRVESADRRLR